MARRHLHELLKEEQEPFVLKNYINERRHHFKKYAPKTHHLHLRARRPISQNPSFLSNFCKKPCFFPSCDTDPPKSPLFDFPRSPCRNPNSFHVNAPTMTAALLLESALRIQKQSSSTKKLKNGGVGFFGTILKRIVLWKTQKREICNDSLEWDSFEELQRFAEDRLPKDAKLEGSPERNAIPELGFPYSCTSIDLLNGLEEKSMDFERSSCCRKEDLEQMVFGGKNGFCSTAFRFQGFEQIPDSGIRTPEFGSPVGSPARRLTEIFPCTSSGHDQSISSRGSDKDEEKEQSSPVSVFDLPFEDDGDVQEPEEKEADEEKEGCFEHNFATVQRAKEQLLNKIRRFERLAELDPLELEKLLEEEEEEEEGRYHDKDNAEGLQLLFDNERIELVKETQGYRSIYDCVWRIPPDVMIDSWNEVESNRIQVMLEMDFRRAGSEWRKNHKEVEEIAEYVELAIFGFLIGELSVDLIESSSL